MLGKVEKIVAIIDESCFCVSASVLSLLTVVAAFMRYVVGKPIMWTEEIQMILVVWTVFFGGSVAFRERGHIAIDILFEKFPRKVQRVMNAVIWTIVTISITWHADGRRSCNDYPRPVACSYCTDVWNRPCPFWHGRCLQYVHWWCQPADWNAHVCYLRCDELQDAVTNDV